MNIILKFLSFLSVFQIVKATITVTPIDAEFEAFQFYAISEDGNVIVTTHRTETESETKDFIRVYRKDDSDSWTNYDEIVLENQHEEFQMYPSISDDGNKFVVIILGTLVDDNGEEVEDFYGHVKKYIYFRVYEYNSNDEIWEIHGEINPDIDFKDMSYVNRLSFGDVKISGNGDRIVTIFHTDAPSEVETSENEYFVSVYGFDSNAKTWNEEKKIEGIHAAISSNGDRITVSFWGGEVKVFGIDTSWHEERTIEFPDGFQPMILRMSGDGETFISVETDENGFGMHLYVCKSEIQNCEKKLVDNGNFHESNISNDGNIVVVATNDQVVLHKYEHGEWTLLCKPISNTEGKRYFLPVFYGDGSKLAVEVQIEGESNYRLELKELTYLTTTGDCGGGM